MYEQTQVVGEAGAVVDPVIVKEYDLKHGSALLARKDDRWLLGIAREVDGEVKTQVLGIDEESVNRDSLHMGYTPAQVAVFEADGMMRKRGWDG